MFAFRKIENTTRTKRISFAINTILFPLICNAETFTFENNITPANTDNGFMEVRSQTFSDGPYRLQIWEGFLVSDISNAEPWSNTTSGSSASFHPTKGANGTPLGDISLVSQRISIFRSDAAAFVLCSANVAKRKNGANYRPLRVYADVGGSGLTFSNGETNYVEHFVSGNNYENKTFDFPGSIDKFKRFEFIVGRDQPSQGLLHFDDIHVASSIEDCD